VGQLITLFG